MNYPKYVNDVVEALQLLPGIGQKSAIRMAFQLLEMNEDNLKKMALSLNDLGLNKKYCKICHSLSENDICDVCADDNRDHSIICVVSNYKDIYAISKMNSFNGVFHVLGGDIKINKGIMPQDLNIDSLISRIDDSVKEIIIATTPSIEGETTALYLSKELHDFNVKITRIAYGMPMGSQLDYIDDLTMLKAFENRKDFKEEE
ncbi:MAG: recombination mediator RecR [Bacilli bacterium]|jgi:recombination protein RecR|nr:recombination mediator RecR [Bacilli bacterium]